MPTNFKVISEVGSKDESLTMKDNEWISYMKKELEAGSWKVIAEAREGGNVGMFKENGDIKESLIKKISNEVNISNILWEAPLKKQQVWFINNFGANVNLGNISPNSIISLECLRLATEFGSEKDRSNPIPKATTYYEWVQKVSKKITLKEPSKKKV